MEFEEASARFSEAVGRLGEAAAQAAVAMGEMLVAVARNLIGEVDFGQLTTLFERLKLEEADRSKAVGLGLVSDRVVELSRCRRVRVRKKNLNRIRKELRLYEKRYGRPG